ncbi:hypothetical protein [Clostridium sp. KNHs214]|uniref:hypothetical protein n=1 Tax=Clostridium sp. KNHs214 TaxID=1540257 RepID=UPI0005533E71|nr:hypothetical protein [Clostridium sp. KNHs214]
MNKIDIKLFKSQSKFKVVLNKLVKQKDILEDKEIYFNNLSAKDVKNLNFNSNNNVEAIYNLISILTNIDMSIDIKEFEEMYNNPTTIFEDFLMNFIEHIQSLLEIKSKAFKTANDISKMDEILKNNGVDLNKLKELQIQEEENEKVKIKNEIEKLYEDMKDDKEHRTEILEQINKLEEKLNNNNKEEI